MDLDPSTRAIHLYREILLDEDLRSLREYFCRTTAKSLANIASWVGLDSFLGGGDLQPRARSLPPTMNARLRFGPRQR